MLNPSFVVAVLASSAWAQCVGPPILIASPAAGRGCREPAIVVSPLNHQRVVAAWIEQVVNLGTPQVVHYALTTDGWATIASTGLVELVGCPNSPTPTTSFDPMVAASPSSGNLWVGAAANDGTPQSPHAVSFSISLIPP